MEANKIAVGMLVYVNGAVHDRGIIVSEQNAAVRCGNIVGRSTVMVYNIMIPATNTMLKDVHAELLEAASEVAFPTGMKVQSKLGGGFTGTVTGHEVSSNRIICKSHKSSSAHDRGRWSYGISELEEYEEYMSFELNHKYQLPNGTVLRTVGVPTHTDRYALINDGSGTFIMYVKDRTKLEWLAGKSLQGLRDMSRQKYQGGIR